MMTENLEREREENKSYRCLQLGKEYGCIEDDRRQKTKQTGRHEVESVKGRGPESALEGA